MPALLQINVLGKPQLTLNGSPLTGLHSKKAIALLAYLACNPGPQRREFLADLLWDTASSAQSLSNLRTVLSRLRVHADDYLLITPETLAIAPAAEILLDVAALEAGIAGVAYRLSAASIPAFAESLALYRGDFLAGFHITGASRFEQWATIERERLHFLVVQSYQHLVGYTIQQAEYPAAIRLATDWLAVDPLDEEAHGQMLRGLAGTGQQAAALAHYASCRKLLATEMDVEPGEELQALHRQIKAGALPLLTTADPTTPAPRRHNLPQRLTSFVGRAEDISLVRALLERPSTRLVTLTGEGGVGKSSLALAAGHALAEQWTGGVGFVSLAEVEAGPLLTLPHRLATALAQAIGLVFSTSRGAAEPTAQLYNYLRGHSLLLILDNFEHLTSGLSFITDLLHAAPACQILVTARQPLLVAGESVVRLDGLPVPPQSAPLPLPDSAYASVVLFVERARQRQHTFTLTSQDRAALARLCRLVAGNALALELAAAWVEHYSLPEMTAQLEADMLDFLRSPQPDVAERHRSLRQVVETSWRLLSPAAQQLLAQLSLFRGSFQRDAALAITGGSLDDLIHLVNTSLLQQQAAGRYELHEMVRQYGGERLAGLPALNAETATRHARYYLALVGRVARTPQMVGLVSQELANVRQAWQWAVENGDVAGLAAASTGLWNFYLRKGLFQEADETFGRAIAAVLARPVGMSGRRHALAALRVAQAVFLNIRSRYSEAIAVAEEAIGYGLQDENEAIIARGYLQWGTALYRQGYYSEAVNRFQMALLAAQDAELKGDQADILRQTGMAWLEQGDFDQAQTHCEEALAIYRRTGNRLGEGNTLNDLGWLNQRRQNLLQSRDYLQAAHRTHAAIENRHGTTMSLINLGIVEQMLGDFSAAFVAFQAVFTALDLLPDPYQSSLVNGSMGLLYSRLGDFSASRRYLLAGLEIDRSIGDQGGLAWGYNTLGLLHNQLGEFKTALAYHAEALRMGREQSAGTVEGIALLGLGQDYFGLGLLAESQATYEQGILVQSKLGQRVRVAESRAGLACTLLGLEQPGLALAQVEQILAYLSTQSLAGAREPTLVYWNCYTVLRAVDDPRAPTLLAQVFDSIQDQAARIEDERLRHSYLHGVRPHPDVLAEVEALRMSPRFGGAREGAAVQGQQRGV